MDETMPIPPFEDDPAALPPASWPQSWPQARPQPSAKLLDSEAWFSEERLLQHARSGDAGGDLP
jgi:hypothetical protein